MPTFDYKCPNKDCDHRENNVVRTNSEVFILVCPNCNTEMQKVPSAPNIIFKGDGWTPRFHGGMNG